MERDEVMKVEGVYMYLCKSCETSFGVVSRFSVAGGDRLTMVTCPKCSKSAFIQGEGQVEYIKYAANKSEIQEVEEENVGSNKKETLDITQLPEILTAKHVSNLLLSSKVFLVLCLNTKNEVVHRCHVGALNSSIVHPREVMKAAILNNAASIIVSHQHPSGNPEPSREDIDVTTRLVEAGKILGIDVLDHIFVTYKGNHYSLKEHGRM
jgi:DNA repair protein RadC